MRDQMAESGRVRRQGWPVLRFSTCGKARGAHVVFEALLNRAQVTRLTRSAIPREERNDHCVIAFPFPPFSCIRDFQYCPTTGILAPLLF